MRARLKIPASKAAGNRVRIGIAIEAPDTSAFFNDLHRLVIGRGNAVSTMYSSAEVAGRSRLRLPEGYTAKPTTKSPNEIDYEIIVPAEAVQAITRTSRYRPTAWRWAGLGCNSSGRRVSACFPACNFISAHRPN